MEIALSLEKYKKRNCIKLKWATTAKQKKNKRERKNYVLFLGNVKEIGCRTNSHSFSSIDLYFITFMIYIIYIILNKQIELYYYFYYIC